MRSRRNRKRVELRRQNVMDILSNSESISILQSENQFVGWEMCSFLKDLEEDLARSSLDTERVEDAQMASAQGEAAQDVAAQGEACSSSSSNRSAHLLLQQVEAYYMRNIYTRSYFPRTYREGMALQPVTVQDLTLFKEKFCDPTITSITAINIMGFYVFMMYIFLILCLLCMGAKF